MNSLISLAVAASSLLISQGPLDRQLVGYQFHVYPSLGRAWVTLETHIPTSYDTETTRPPNEFQNIQIPGLVYEDGKIVFNGTAGKTVCADIISKPHTLLIRPTHACGVRSEIGTHVIDPGFEPYTEVSSDVYFFTR